jgi:ketosteroid isomerase-like protein
MIHRSVLCLLTGVAFYLGACAPKGESESREQMVAEAKALDQRFVEAYNKGDAEAIAATYWNSPDVVSYPPGELEIRGWNNLKEGFVKEFSAMAGGKLELMDEKYMVAGDVVISWGKWRYTMSQPPMEMIGRFTDVKAKRDGKWVYLLDHASAPMPPPPAEPAKKK